MALNVCLKRLFRKRPCNNLSDVIDGVAFGVGRLSASLAAVILCLEGVGAMTVGALFYAENRDVWDLSAVILIVSGIALAQRDAAG